MNSNSLLIVFSFVLLSSLMQSSSSVRFSRSMRYAMPPMRRYFQPWKYVPLVKMPRSMQRRFMWREMDDTVDGLMGSVASGAKTMTHMFSPSMMVRYRKPFEFDTQPSKKVKYIIKKPPAPPPPPFKHIKVVNYHSPKNPIPFHNHVQTTPINDYPSVPPTTQKPSFIMPYMSEEELRKIEKDQEKRVENESDGKGIHEHSHQTHMDDDIVSGRINEFGEDWLPLKGPFSTSKPYAVGRLHTKIELPTLFTPTALPLIRSEPKKKHEFSYEVTEHSAAASALKELTFKPSNHFDFLSTATTTEGPNYPDYFLKSFSNSEEEFAPRRVPTSSTVFISTTTVSSRRLPPNSTTEHPFKRYNLHRPKSSKLFFQQRPTNNLDSTKPSQTLTTTEQSYKVHLDLAELPKTTSEPVKTTREPSSTTTKEPKRAPPEKVRTTRMNSENKSKLRIKNSSQSESLNKVLNKHRGSVKFGEKTS